MPNRDDRPRLKPPLRIDWKTVAFATLNADPSASTYHIYRLLCKVYSSHTVWQGQEGLQPSLLAAPVKETLKNSAALILNRGKSVTWSSIQLRFRLFSVCPKARCPPSFPRRR